ncbi:uncharacterized protein LOC126621049 [Malus sylvestris]|uniref:uncharacterized protein LOC126621049 n=1 Tax=Malus sylvestris TaxID=3752 RepID=UPI0021ACB18E|nr:uncharacterized protein LOC126621049 [Malus sylvestris]
MGVFILVLQDIILVSLVDIAFSTIITRVKENLIRDIGILILIQDISFRIMDLILHLYFLGFLDLLRHSILVILLHSKFLVNCVINLVTLLHFVIQNSWNDWAVKFVVPILVVHTILICQAMLMLFLHLPSLFSPIFRLCIQSLLSLSNLSLASPYPSNETVQTANGEGQSHMEDIIQRTMY